MQIGDWVQREHRGVPHLIESIVSGDVVTRCGKRMKDEPNRDGRLVRADPSHGRLIGCQWCVRGET